MTLKAVAAGAGGGAASGITIGTSVITGGTNTRVLFDDSGLIGESAGLTYAKASGLLTPTLLVVTSAGAAGTPSLSVQNATTGFYSVSTTGLGVSINGTSRLDYGISSAGVWTFGATAAFALVTGTSFNGLVVSTTTGTFTLTNAKTLAVTNSLTLSGTDGTTMTFPATSSNVLTTGNTATITKGYTLTPNNIGTVSSGTTTLDAANGNYQYLTNNGAFTLAAMAADSAVDLLVTNGASAGAITFSGFTVGSSTGSALTTTNTNKFIISCRRINSVATYSVYALQ